MRTFLLIAVLLLPPAWAAAQPSCCGDCAGDGEVTISDLITAVNNALGMCPSATPSPTVPAGQCPIDFQDDNTQNGTPDCYYRGRWNQNCGDANLESLWRSDGEFVIVQLLGFDQGIYLGAEVTGSGSADLLCWYLNEDASDCDSNPASGTIALSDGGGNLNVTASPPPFTIDQCNFARYRGALFDVVTPASARAAGRLARPAPEALQRLRDMARTHAPGRDFQRR
ncbi:MAG: hypothetical protein SF182_27755 [Deltaproteobacteria bacterium]|nr:hypothetical protein [Deltaproteobacteria bacterium]